MRLPGICGQRAPLRSTRRFPRAGDDSAKIAFLSVTKQCGQMFILTAGLTFAPVCRDKSIPALIVQLKCHDRRDLENAMALNVNFEQCPQDADFLLIRP